MSEDSTPVAPAGRSWRDISQEVTPRAMSAKGWRRRQLAWIKYTLVITVTAGLGWGGWLVVDSWKHDRAALASAVHSEIVRETVLITDGVLTQKWVVGTLALPPGVTLMELDLARLRDRLTAQGQVRVAVLTRSFPDTLVVTLQERTPVARVQVQEGEGRPRPLFVARDGVVYEGVNYDPGMVASLPWLDGVRLVRSGGGYAPIAGMDTVADLLAKAQLQAPHLYRTWLIVSLARLATHDEILVKSQDIPEIIFTRREDFFKQVSQLDYVMDMAAQVPDAGLQSVNLALGGQVPVRLNRSPDELAKQQPPGGPAPNFNLQPTQTRKGQRDL
ncbi:MAG: cell division protein FtsQ/DivIB [Opitutales bacterium]